MSEIDTAVELGRLAVSVGEMVAKVLAVAFVEGDTATLDALSKVIPSPEILAARDRALEILQREKALEILGGKPSEPDRVQSEREKE